LEEDNEKYEYFYRAMSWTEFNNNGQGLIIGKYRNGKWEGEPNYTTTNIEYLTHPGPGLDGCTKPQCKGLLRRELLEEDYHIVVKYKVNKGTINALNKTKVNNIPKLKKLLKKRLVVAKKEGTEFIYPDGTITYGFHADIANDNFHPNIIEITYIKKEKLL